MSTILIYGVDVMAIKKDEDWSDLEFFKDKGRVTSDSYVAVHERGTISFSTGFIKKNKSKVQNKTHIKLGYSKNMHALSIEFITEEDFDGTFRPLKLSSHTTSLYKYFSAHSYLKSKVDNYSDSVGRYDADFEKIANRGEFLIIRLESNNKNNPG